MGVIKRQKCGGLQSLWKERGIHACDCWGVEQFIEIKQGRCYRGKTEKDWPLPQTQTHTHIHICTYTHTHTHAHTHTHTHIHTQKKNLNIFWRESRMGGER